MIIDIVIVNFPTMFAVMFAALFIPNLPNKKMFIFGLTLNLLSGVVAIPYSNWVFKNFTELLQNNEFFVSLSTLPIGALQLIGLLLCIVSFAKAVRREPRGQNT